jgi:hypothetical protein
MTITKLALFAGLVVASGAAMAQTDGTTARKVKGDPNRTICRTVETTGSRLQRTRKCATAAEWAEAKALDRREIERMQALGYKGSE